MSSQRAGVSVRSRRGKSSTDNTRRRSSLRPSLRRFHAASKRSSASRASPTRSSKTLAKAASRGGDIALEVIAQLLHRLEVVGRAAAAHRAPPVLVHDPIAVGEPIATIIVELDVQQVIPEQDGFPEDHIWLITP